MRNCYRAREILNNFSNWYLNTFLLFQPPLHLLELRMIFWVTCKNFHCHDDTWILDIALKFCANEALMQRTKNEIFCSTWITLIYRFLNCERMFTPTFCAYMRNLSMLSRITDDVDDDSNKIIHMTKWKMQILCTIMVSSLAKNCWWI